MKVADRLRDRARRGSLAPHLASGRRGEDIAHRLLRAEGYTIVARNYRTKSGSGEVDIIAWDGAILAFVEVKARESSEFGLPERAVDVEKQERLLRAARNYARSAEVPWERVRFDIVSVVFSPAAEVTLIRDAFPAHTRVS